MSSKMSIISALWDQWLDRYVPPTNLRGNDRAKGDELDAQVRMLLRYAPNDRVEDWIQRLTDRLDRSMKTSAWPRVAQIEDECTAMRREDHQTAGGPVGDGNESWKPDHLKIAASRMQAGGAVGEDYLWGRYAAALLRRGLVTTATIEQYRGHAYRAKAKIHPQAQVDQWLAEKNQMHAAGVELDATAGKERRRRPDVAVHIPDMSSPHREYRDDL